MTSMRMHLPDDIAAQYQHEVVSLNCRDGHNVLAPHERSAAALHTASAAAGSGGLLDGQPDFLAKRHLQGMAVGIADGSQIPDGRTRVSRAVEEPPFPTRQRAQSIHFLPTRAGHTQVGGGTSGWSTWLRSERTTTKGRVVSLIHATSNPVAGTVRRCTTCIRAYVV